jgi:hypothetical protein
MPRGEILTDWAKAVPLTAAGEFFERERLLALADSIKHAYEAARPFPHVVIDDFLPAKVAEAMLAEFPEPEEIEWEHSYADRLEVKLACADQTKFGLTIRYVLHELNSSAFVTFLERLTGVDGLIPDPHLSGGGLHQILPGGYLKIHADFNWYARMRVDRRLNLLLYLNREWSEDFGGHLELWNEQMTTCAKRILPIFNRCVIFSTTDHSYHGHPDPLTCPPGRARKSLALYYYSNGRPEHEHSPSHSTLFRERPMEAPEEEILRILRRRRLIRSVSRWVPPMLWDWVQWLRRHFRETPV